MTKCPICGKELQERGLGGHLYGVHGKRVGLKVTLEDLQDRLAALEERLANLEGESRRVLDWIDGLTTRDFPEKGISALGRPIAKPGKKS